MVLVTSWRMLTIHFLIICAQRDLDGFITVPHESGKKRKKKQLCGNDNELSTDWVTAETAEHNQVFVSKQFFPRHLVLVIKGFLPFQVTHTGTMSCSFKH